MTRHTFATLIFLAPFVASCRDGAGVSPAVDAGATGPASTMSSAPAAPGPSAPAPLVRRSAPRAPTRASATCPPAKPGTKRYPPANGNECTMRGGHVTVVDSPEREAANHHPASICRDDDCTTDTSCGADRICACAPPGAKDAEAHPRCVFGNCTSDADCGGFVCEGTLALGIPSEPANVSGVLGRYCRSAADTCKEDKECPNAQNGERCLFTDAAFRCRMPR